MIQTCPHEGSTLFSLKCGLGTSFITLLAHLHIRCLEMKPLDTKKIYTNALPPVWLVGVVGSTKGLLFYRKVKVIREYVVGPTNPPAPSPFPPVSNSWELTEELSMSCCFSFVVFPGGVSASTFDCCISLIITVSHSLSTQTPLSQ